MKKPAALAMIALTEEQQAIVEAGGNEAAIGTDLTDAEHGTQLDLWYRNGRTLVRAARDGVTVQAWSFRGNIAPHDCRERYLASVNS